MDKLTASVGFAAQLRAAAEPRYRAFMAKLLPTVPAERILGVRVPSVRRIAKQNAKSPQTGAFLANLPHRYYEEDLLHALFLNELRDPGECLAAVERFLPFVDNWGVCDSLRPRAFAAHADELLPHIRRWIGADAPFTVRFGMEMLMMHFLGERFSPEYPALVVGVRSEHYYVRMMQAWYLTAALAAKYQTVLPYLTHTPLSPALRRMTVQKVADSRCFTAAQKAQVRSLLSVP